MKKRFVWILLSLCMALALFSTQAFAEEGEEAEKYNITVIKPEHGRVTVDKAAAAGETVYVRVTLGAGYCVESVTGTTGDTGKTFDLELSFSYEAQRSFKFVMPAEDVTVTVKLEEAPARNVTVPGDPDGVIRLYRVIDSMNVYGGRSFARYNVWFDCPGGYKIVKAEGRTASGEHFPMKYQSSSMSQFYFNMPDEDVVLELDLRKLYNLTWSSGTVDGGRITVSVKENISPSDHRTAGVGDTVNVTAIIVDQGAEPKGITVTQSDGTEIIPTFKGTNKGQNVYSFTMPASDVTVTGQFEPPPITATLQEDGSATLNRVPTGTIAFVYAASYDSNDRMTKLVSGQLTNKTIVFSEKMVAGSYIFLLDTNHTPLCPKIPLCT